MTNLQDEVWEDVEDYEEMYQISNFGRAKSLERMVRHWRGGLKTEKEKILKPSLIGTGRRRYYRVMLSKNGKAKMKLIHRLVAQYFVPNPDNLPQVNHDDNDPLNNHYTNLSWVTNRENKNHGMTFHKTASIYPGVVWNKKSNKWQSQIYINGQSQYLGLFNCEVMAAEAYQNALKEVLEPLQINPFEI